MKLPSTRALIAATAIVGALALTLSGCSGGSSSSSSSSGDTTLTLGTITPVTTFAAKDARFANESPYMQAVYDTLLHAAPDGTVEPWLATKWSYNADNTVLTMTLRNDVVFSDGTKFTADVAAQNLLRFRDGTSPQKAYLATLKDAKAVDDTTLELDLSAPNPALLSFLTQNPGLMESPKNFDAKSEATVPIGSGPYLLDQKDTVVGSKYVFTKNPKYWGPKNQQTYAKLVMIDYQTPTAMLNAIKGGQINAGTLTDNTTIDQVKAAGYTVSGQQLNFFGLLLFDRGGTKTKALGDVRVRQAINYALDRKALLKAVGKGYGDVTEQVFGSSSTAYDKSLDSTYSFDPAKAKQLLSEAGYSA
jgi:peptide/nickel transport system substrate-binding protein